MTSERLVHIGTVIFVLLCAYATIMVAVYHSAGG